MATSAVNGASIDANGSTSRAPSSQQQQNRASFAKMSADPPRKADEDTTQRRTPQPKAWTGINPITQRSNTPSQANGAAAKPSPKSFLQEQNTPDKIAMDRQAWVLHHSVGLQCTITTKSGEQFSGVFAGSRRLTDDFKFLFKMVKEIGSDAKGNASAGQTNNSSAEYQGFGPEHSRVFTASSLAVVNVPEAQTSPHPQPTTSTSSGFRTDTDISGKQSMRERNLQRWEAPSTKGVDMSLESSGGEWDQFKANEERFGVKSDYDENIYTTKIDRNNPLYAMRERKAALIAREIEGDLSTNAHMREERGFRDDGLDEEEKYSGVRRAGQDYPPLESNQPDRYMPPGRRAQVAPTTSGEGPVDPAIISSQIARSDSAQAAASESKPLAKAGQKTEAKTEKRTEQLPAPKSEQKPQIYTKDLRPLRQPGKSGATATENVETEVLDSFRQFAANEKIKVQDQKRSRASADKAVKLNDLMKFSKNFKLLTPVPKDLIPILAKDEVKQREIVSRAQRIAESTTSSKGSSSTLTDQKSQRPLAAARWDVESVAPSSDAAAVARGTAGQNSKDRHQQIRGVPQNGFSAKLADSYRMHKAGLPPNVPHPLPIAENRVAGARPGAVPSALSSPQKPPSIRGPPSATSGKFNAKASEFKPNPAASAFKPGGASISVTTAASSPRSGSATRAMSPSIAPAKLFGDKKSFGKWNERANPIGMAAPTKRHSTETEDGKGGVANGLAKGPPLPPQNGGFQFPYRTHPTWTLPPEGDNAEPEVKYYEAFQKAQSVRQGRPRSQASPINAAAHQHQLPFHLQNGPHGNPNVQAGHHLAQPVQTHPHQFPHGPHFDDHHMRHTASNSSAYPAPSPRMQNGNVAFQSPMPPHTQMAYGQSVQYVMHQGAPMNARQFSNGPQMMPAPGTHLAPMMIQQSSSGGYLPQPMAVPFNPQVPMYPNQAPPMYGSPSQPPSGFPSPGRGAPMMVHQGSQQSHHQPAFLPAGQYGHPVYAQQPPNHMTSMRGGYGSPQPHFAQNSFPQHQFPHQPHRTPSTGYAQPHQVHQVHHQPMPAQQGPSQPAGPTDTGEEGK